jgi:peptide/nickel transport system substrate-binding protein
MILRPTRREALAFGGAAAALALGLPRGVRAEPKRGGTLRVAKGHGSTSDTLDPALWTNGYMVAHAYAAHNHLTEVLPDGSLGAEIAESWEASADAATWTFRIRQGVTFHNSRTVTPADVVASINHHRGEDSQSAAKPIIEPVTDIRADGDTVVVTLSGGNADFPFMMSDYHLPILPANGDGSIDWQSGIGCGPYRTVEFDPGVSSRYVRNPDYWKSGRAWVDEIVMLSIVDPTARTNALMTGEVDAIDKVEPRTATLLGRNPQIALNEVAGTQHYTFAMHTDAAPFDDVNVRLALKWGLNRQEMVEKVLSGFGVVGNDHPIGPNQRYHHDGLPQREFDPERARYHLRQAGLNSLPVQLSAADAAFPGAVDAAQLFAETARQSGIDLTVNRVPNDGYWSNVWLKDPFCAVYWGGRPTEDWMFATAYEAGVPWNDTNWTNERFMDLLLTARAELDDEKRRGMYHEMQEIVSNDGGAIIPMFASYVFATGPAVAHDEQVAANWDMDGEKWAERWWLV